MSQTIQQQRAKFAMDEVNNLKVLKADEQKEFISYASSLPAMIHTNGLGQAMAFCKVKGKDRVSYKKLYELISNWLCAEKQIYENCNDSQGKKDVLTGITNNSMQDYQLAQTETLILMSWVKKFAKAFLAEEEVKNASTSV